MLEMTIRLRSNPFTQKQDLFVDRRMSEPLSRDEKREWVEKLAHHPHFKISGLGRIFFIEAESK